MNLDSVKQIAEVDFSDTYLEAREKFLAAVPNARAYPCSAKGPSGEALYTDVAYFGPTDAKRLLVLISGTHGPEGYHGSAAQLLFLRAKYHEQLPHSTAVLFIHALNCYGFAWNRRATVEGCDLNRNFIDFSSPIPPNPGYEELDEFFVPEDRSEEGIRRAETAIDQYRKLHGDAAYLSARAQGQYTRPGGLFYGGTEPTEARRTLEKIMADFDVSTRDEVIIIDYHTGLGPYGYGEIQCEQPSGLKGYHRAEKIFGPSVTLPDLGTSTSPNLHGTLDEYFQRLLGDRHTYVAVEYGTYPISEVMSAIRDEHWLFRFRPDQADSELGREIRNASKRSFYPQKPDWQEMVLWRAHLVHRQALEALASE
ncbi:M14 family metallopeptidase [Microvirga sp. VF16]|uniref:M14 family metallopeptidase n=1 Tax=Microvirga sp. VF16 TaxID=2807101 RepID=UPI00193C90C2|nr:M14 family metallopeptidase [Microvirga sp. VF16]QRM32849.1 M14 family metallopeptidase [Microvirga sp. VF16]